MTFSVNKIRKNKVCEKCLVSKESLVVIHDIFFNESLFRDISFIEHCISNV